MHLHILGNRSIGKSCVTWSLISGSSSHSIFIQHQGSIHEPPIKQCDSRAMDVRLAYLQLRRLLDSHFGARNMLSCSCCYTTQKILWLCSTVFHLLVQEINTANYSYSAGSSCEFPSKWSPERAELVCSFFRLGSSKLLTFFVEEV